MTPQVYLECLRGLLPNDWSVTHAHNEETGVDEFTIGMVCTGKIELLPGHTHQAFDMAYKGIRDGLKQELLRIVKEL